MSKILADDETTKDINSLHSKQREVLYIRFIYIKLWKI